MTGETPAAIHCVMTDGENTTEKLIYGQPGHLIRRAHQRATAAFLEETAHLGITPIQYAMLVVINENPGLDATRVSDLIAIDRATVGNVASRLEARGLLTRTVDKHDSRSKNIFVTQAGVAVIDQIRPLVGSIADRMLSGLDAARREQLIAILNELVDIDAARERARSITEAR